MTSLTHSGIKHRNEILLTEACAERFAQMLRANPLFQDVTVQEQEKARGKRRHFVSYRPANLERREELRDIFQAQQDGRADSEWMNYVVYETDKPGTFDVEKQETLDTYSVSLHPSGHDCSCPQMEHRCAKEGISCKHPRIVQIHQALGLVQPAPAIIPAPAPAPRFRPVWDGEPDDLLFPTVRVGAAV